MHATTRLLIATRNKGKLREFETMLAGFRVSPCSLADFPDLAEPDEPHATFGENARHKATYYAAATGLVALADDSGLEVAALGGAPGVRSARYGGANLTDDERTRLLLRALDATRGADRRARFVCVVAVARPDSPTVYEAIGVCDGGIVASPRGANGFGYDPVFAPAGYARTFAELDADVKNRISHRALALGEIRKLLPEILDKR